MDATAHLIARLWVQGSLYSAVRIVRDEMERIARAPESQPVRPPRFAYRMTLRERVRRA